MHTIDLAIALFYLAGTLAIGLYLSRQNKNVADMFVASQQSPWWVAGLSSFMTIKSAGTFVVWGGLAYREGIVAIIVTSALGISGIIVGWLLAGQWRRSGVGTPAEFVELRFGRPAVLLYSFVMMAVRIVTSGIALYAVSVMLAALIPLDAGNLLRDPATGNIALWFVVAALGLMVTVYTVAGGLWAVLVTDVLQFIILKLAIIFVIPLVAYRLWVAPELLPVPDTFFSPFTGGYTSWFVLGWITIHVFTIGAEWAYAQRYICVPTETDARKSAYLFGALYIISPTLWLAPAVMFRFLEAGVPPEQAYVLVSQSVLPIGMLGMMMAAMFSATASMVSGQINVYAGVLTEQFYARWRPESTDRQLMTAGRLFSLALGAAMTLLGIFVPWLGGAEQVIVSISSLLLGPLMAPTAIGLLTGRIDQRSVFVTVGICLVAAIVVRFGPATFLADSSVGAWISENPHSVEISIGAVLPLIILGIIHFMTKEDSAGWQKVQARSAAYRPLDQQEEGAPHAPPVVIAVSLAVSGIITLALLFVNESGRLTLLLFGVVLMALAAWSWSAAKKTSPPTI